MGIFDKVFSGSDKQDDNDNNCGTRGFVKGALTNLRHGESPTKHEVDSVLKELKKKK